MRKGFALLETLFALLVFSILLIGGAKIFLSLQKDHHVFTEKAREETLMQNVFFLLQNTLTHSFLFSFSSSLITFYPLDAQAFFSPDFSITPRFTTPTKLTLSYSPKDTSYLLALPSQTLYPVMKKTTHTLELPHEAKEKYFLPLLSQYRLSFIDSRLYLNGEILLEGVREFAMNQKGEFFEIKICTKQCYEYSFRAGRIYEIL